jgi:transposase
MTTTTLPFAAAPIVDDGWRIPDPLWQRLEPLLPKRHVHRKGGRPPLPWRLILDGIFFVLRTGCQWKAVPKAFGSGSSLHRYFQSLVRRRLFRKLWRMALEEYDELKGIDWEWQAMDGCMTKAPLGGEKNREKPHGPGQKGDQTVAVDGGQGRAVGSDGQWCQSPRQRVGPSDPGIDPDRATGAYPRTPAEFLRR